MKKNLIRQSGIGLVMLAGLGIGNVGATLSEDNIYDSLQSFHEQSIKTHGAQGPIREEGMQTGVQPAADDIYQSLSKFQSEQALRSGERGAKGPVRSQGDMAMERNREEWKKLVGFFATSGD